MGMSWFNDDRILGLVSLFVTVVLGGFAIWQASRAAASAKLAEERSQENLEATREALASSDENTRKQIEAMEKMLRDFLDDPRQPKFGGPVKNESGEYTGGNIKNGYVSASANTAHARMFNPTVHTQQNPIPPVEPSENESSN
jgi:3-mercaptopyruvate sulfurtransferase SseA